MAAKDDNGQLMEVPGLFIENELQLRRYAEAKELKKISLEKRKMFKSDLNYKTIKELKLDTKYDKCKIEF